MTRYLLVDTNNMFMRARHVSKGDAFLQSSLCIHIVLSSIRSVWKKLKIDHVVFCLEGRSWRKDYYPKYKANRSQHRQARTVEEQESDTILYDAMNKFVEFIRTKTNCTVIHHPKCEADDLIAGYIQYSKNLDDEFIILSTDTDFFQLISPKVKIYDGINQKIYQHDGIFKENGQPYRDKNGTILQIVDPEWALFEKCIRGDSSDNIMSAYPNARVKGTKTKIGIREAFEDRMNKGFTWNNFMLQRWVDHNKKEHIVRDCYALNEMLIDLSKQPNDIREIIKQTIEESFATRKKILMIGVHLLKFCKMYDLQRISDSPNPYIEFLNAGIK